MWICPECNSLVPYPVKRKCPRGHPLWDFHIFGTTEEKSFGAGFGKGLAVGLFWVIGALAASYFMPGIFGDNARIGAVAGLIVIAFDSFWQGHKWRRQGGPALHLVPAARGVALGCVAALAIVVAIGYAAGQV
jgi:hypothetical protein